MLKAHQACIDLAKNVLRIQDREVRFLAEHELPDKARNPELVAEQEALLSSASSSSSRPGANANTSSSFPGGGRTLGSAPTPANAGRSTTPAHSSAMNRYPEEQIVTLMGFGVSREVAIRTLDAAGGNIDVAASLLFS
jgi:DNA damage-inducible protein 1